MREVTVDEAIKKGMITLFWTPVFLLFLFLIGGLGLGLLIPDKILWFLPTGIVLAFTLPWLWWSMKVVSWKIWAYSHVKDGKTLEKRAISRQLIWPRGSFFEKTEIKSDQEKRTLEELYQKMDSTEVVKEIITDESLPEELTIDYPKTNFYVYLVVSLGCIYLIYIERYFIGVLGVVASLYSAYDLNKKLRNKEFLLKLNDSGVILPTTTHPWTQIESYYLEKEGFGKSTTHYLIIKGRGIQEKIPLAEANVSPFTMERYMDVYRSRYDRKRKLTRI